MTSATQPLTHQGLTITALRTDELENAVQSRTTWLWRGYLAPGKLTALISPPKSGKTTLLTHMLVSSAEGGQLAGLPVGKARALVLSEESIADWDARCKERGVGRNVRFICRPFKGARPSDEQWFALIDGLEALHRQEPIDLVVIDGLAAFLPGYADACGPKLLDCLLPLQTLANQGIAVWLLHHTSKDKRPDGLNARGASALAGLADIVMEMSCVRRARSRDRRRRIRGYSRYAETPRHIILELDPDGTNYTVRTDAAGTPIVQTWREMHYILGGAFDKLSIQQILERWPAEDGPPDRSTLSRWLKRATEQGLIHCTGAGLKDNPHRYWLPTREPFLRPPRDASKEEKQRWQTLVAEHYKPAWVRLSDLK